MTNPLQQPVPPPPLSVIQTTYQDYAEKYRKRAEEARRARTTPSKARKGFPVKLTGKWCFFIQAAYAYLKVRGHTTPGMDEAINLVPDIDLLQRNMRLTGKTLRVRGDQVGGMIELLEKVAHLPGAPCTLHARLKDLREISAANAIMDAAR